MQRERYIDIVKGLAILCIVLLHYENGLFPTKVNVLCHGRLANGNAEKRINNERVTS